MPFARLLTVSLATAAVMVAPASASPHSRPNPVIAWNAHAGKAALAACIAPADNPLSESRMYAMSHLAIHDALNALDRRSNRTRTTLTRGVARRRTPPSAAAARDVLVPVLGQLQAPFRQACIDAGVASVESDYAAALPRHPGRPTEGARPGRRPRRRHGRPGAEVRRWHQHDAVGLRLHARPPAPGEWIFTPDRPFTGWAHVTPFVLDAPSQFRPGPPYALDSPPDTPPISTKSRHSGATASSPRARALPSRPRSRSSGSKLTAAMEPHRTHALR